MTYGWSALGEMHLDPAHNVVLTLGVTNMKVRDLIRQLELHPPDAFIIVIDDDGGGYDCAHYLDGVVEPITVEDTPYRNEGPPDYKMIYGKPWQETVLAIRGRRYLWDVSHELFEAGHSGNPFEEGGEPNDQ